MREPPKNRDIDALDLTFYGVLWRVLEVLRIPRKPFKLDEGFRTPERQAWLYAQGRTRRGSIVTNKNGVEHLSNHQGTGVFGSGRAADCYPCGADEKLIWPPPPDDDPIWNLYATIAESQGLTAGYRWKSPHDPPHVELRASK